MFVALSVQIKQSEFSRLVGVSEPRVSQMVSDGILAPGASALEWLHTYCGRLREQAAGRGIDGPLDLAQERAALARAQREAVELKNATLRGEYAEVALLAEVLAAASQAVADRFDHLPGVIKKSCPQITDADREQVLGVIADARNEWVRVTCELVAQRVASTDDDTEDEPRPD